jgi:hypothetical protein
VTIFLRWIRATWLGFVLGVPFIAVLALLGEAIGIGGAQGLVGAGLGLGVGFLQARALHGVLDRRGRWIWSSVVGLAVPFLAIDLARLAGWTLPYFLLICIALGGLIAGGWQAAILRTRFQGTAVWILASTGGWALAGALALYADSLSASRALRGGWGALAYLGMISIGGLAVGLVTGVALVSIVRQHRRA